MKKNIYVLTLTVMIGLFTSCNGSNVSQHDIDNGAPPIAPVPAPPPPPAIGKATLLWDDNSVGGEAEFAILRRLPVEALFKEIGSVSQDATKYIDQPLKIGEAYCYKVCVRATLGSAYDPNLCSNEDCGTVSSVISKSGKFEWVPATKTK